MKTSIKRRRETSSMTLQQPTIRKGAKAWLMVYELTMPSIMMAFLFLKDGGGTSDL